MSDFLSGVENTVIDATTKVGRFIQHYGSELTSVTGILSQLVGALPIDQQDKANITDTIDGLNQAAERAIAGANAVATGGDVVVQRSDVDAALADYFASDAGKAAFEAAVKAALPVAGTVTLQQPAETTGGTVSAPGN